MSCLASLYHRVGIIDIRIYYIIIIIIVFTVLQISLTEKIHENSFLLASVSIDIPPGSTCMYAT